MKIPGIKAKPCRELHLKASVTKTTLVMLTEYVPFMNIYLQTLDLFVDHEKLLGLFEGLNMTY